MRIAITYRMTQLEARIHVLEHETTVLRGLRIGSNISVAEAAVRREREVENEIREAQKGLSTQQELFSVVSHGEDDGHLKVAED